MMPLASPADLPSFLAAFAAGLLSFVSPCVLPLVPVYLSYISGESAQAIKRGAVGRWPLFVRSLAFVFGFTAVFVALAFLTGGGMNFAGQAARLVIMRVGGAVVILFALNVWFDFLPFLRATLKPNLGPASRNQVNPVSAGNGGPLATTLLGSARAIALGMAFAAGWTPCVGPILASILLFAGQSGDVTHAIALLALYSAGLGVPFLIVGLFLDRATPLLDWFKRHDRVIKAVSALLLAALGLAMLTGSLTRVTAFLTSALGAAGR
jgi:cytochrome c-type biogenesis protein